MMLKVRDGEKLFWVGKTKSGKTVVLNEEKTKEIPEQERSEWIMKYVATRYNRLPVCSCDLEEKVNEEKVNEEKVQDDTSVEIVEKSVETQREEVENTEKKEEVKETEEKEEVEETEEKEEKPEVKEDSEKESSDDVVSDIAKLKNELEKLSGKPVSVDFTKLTTKAKLISARSKIKTILKRTKKEIEKEQKKAE